MAQSNNTVDILRKNVGPGDTSVTWQEFNVLADVARSTQRNLPGQGTLDGSASATRLPPTTFRPGWFEIQNDSAVDLGQYSVFRFSSIMPSTAHPDFKVVVELNDNLDAASGYGYLCTNGENHIPAGRSGWCKVIDRVPTKVRTDDSGFLGVPMPGFRVTYSADGAVGAGTSSSGEGTLLCISEVFAEGGNSYVIVMESPNRTMLVEVVEEVTACSDSCSGILTGTGLGIGLGKVLGRGGEVLVKHPHLGTIPWEMQIHNLHEVTYPIGQVLMIQETLNVGNLIIFSCPCE